MTIENGGLAPPDEERARTRISRALGVAEPEPSLRSRVMASMPIDMDTGGRRREWAAAGVAVLLGLAAVSTFLVTRHISTAGPASSGRLLGSVNITAQVGFRCSLPVAGYTTLARISFPDGGVTVDKVLDGSAKGASGYGQTYAGGRWLPVPAGWVSPGGRSYAYITVTSGVPGKQPTSALFVHDVSTGQARQLWSGDSAGQVVGWGPGGVYFSRQPISPTAPTGPELWVVDPSNPAGVHRVGPNPPPAPQLNPARPAPPKSYLAIASGAAWAIGYVSGTTDTGYFPSSVDRLDLRDGSVSTWFVAPEGMVVSFMGADAAGHPLLLMYPVAKPQPGAGPSTVPTKTAPPPPQVRLLTGPNQTLTVAGGGDTTFRPGMTAADKHGIWFSSPGALWLFRDGSLTKVADIPTGLFPVPTPPPGVQAKGGVAAGSPPPGYPTGVTLSIAGACT